MKFILILTCLLFVSCKNLINVELKNILSGNSDNNSSNSTSSNSNSSNLLLFSDNDTTTGAELYKSDGTVAGTTLLKEIYPGLSSSSSSNFTKLNNKIIFTADDGTNGKELWITDGSLIGTYMLKDICPGACPSNPSNTMFVSNNKLYFSADDGINGTELWVTDGTEAGTQLIKDINPSGSSNPDNYFYFNSKIYFTAEDDVHGVELWVTDGTNSGTTLLKEITVGFTAAPNISNFVDLGSSFLFIANDRITYGSEIWKSDGTTAGTNVLHDITVGSSGSFPINLKRIGNEVYFYAQSPYNLFKTDGTTLTQLTNFTNNWSPTDAMDAGDYVVVLMSDGSDKKLFSINKITNAITALNASSTYLFNVNQMYSFNNKVYIVAESTTGENLYVTDGTLAGTETISLPKTFSDIDGSFYEYNNKLYWMHTTSSSIREFWVTDGTSAGTRSIIPSTVIGTNYPQVIKLIGNKLYFSIDNYSTGKHSLWVVDLDTETATMLIEFLGNLAA